MRGYKIIFRKPSTYLINYNGVYRVSPALLFQPRLKQALVNTTILAISDTS